jgi:Type II CAAX prenyl endopeptidase Rce1-like
VSRGRARARAEPGAFGRGDLTASLVLVFPVLLAYEIGVLFSSTINGVDVITRAVFALCGGDRVTYLVVHASLALVYLVWLRSVRRDRTLSLDVVAPLVIEAALYALSLGAILPLVVAHAHLAIAQLSPGYSGLGHRGQEVVMSLGAGVHEELVFRLGALAGGLALLVRAGVERRAAFLIALAGSALLFSAAHHLGVHGEPLHASVFVYRALAGVVFGLIFWYRSFAHAVYAHVLYDLYVLVVRG